MSEITTLRVKKTTRDRLEDFGHKSDSFDAILNRLMDNSYTKGTLVCEKCKEPLAICNMLDDSNNLIGYSHSCRTCGYSFSEKV